jgi:hypothetical protein
MSAASIVPPGIWLGRRERAAVAHEGGVVEGDQAGGDADQAGPDGQDRQWPHRPGGPQVEAGHREVAGEGERRDGGGGGQGAVGDGFGQPAGQPAGGGEGSGGDRDRDGDQGNDRDRGQQGEQAGAPRVRLQQQEPPEADQGSGGDIPGDGVPGVGGGQFPGERVRDGVWRAEGVDR